MEIERKGGKVALGVILFSKPIKRVAKIAGINVARNTIKYGRGSTATDDSDNGIKYCSPEILVIAKKTKFERTAQTETNKPE